MLMVAADEASVGMGFSMAPGTVAANHDDGVSFSDYYLDQYESMLDGKEITLAHLPYSLCMLVDPCEACVQPKTTTAQVGCTLRSLSHHLALLPPWGEVKTTWRFASQFASGILNMLVVPFPYRRRKLFR